jgi:hypothetical protein
MLDNINKLESRCDKLIFQMGFNWKGDIKQCLFSNGTKKEMIDFIKKGTENYWNIESIGIAQVDSNGSIVYEDLNENNIKRDDTLGEFLNRPIFILKSKKNKYDG